MGNDEDSHFVILEPFATTSMPPNLMRGFGTASDEEGLLLGTDPNGVQ